MKTRLDLLCEAYKQLNLLEEHDSPSEIARTIAQYKKDHDLIPYSRMYIEVVDNAMYINSVFVARIGAKKAAYSSKELYEQGTYHENKCLGRDEI